MTYIEAIITVLGIFGLAALVVGAWKVFSDWLIYKAFKGLDQAQKEQRLQEQNSVLQLLSERYRSKTRNRPHSKKRGQN
ncbi:MAG: type II secretion system protein [Chlamydiia bacterium]|nr:type II secretion system protein [Chlamydiia bacterium]